MPRLLCEGTCQSRRSANAMWSAFKSRPDCKRHFVGLGYTPVVWCSEVWRKVEIFLPQWSSGIGASCLDFHCREPVLQHDSQKRQWGRPGGRGWSSQGTDQAGEGTGWRGLDGSSVRGPWSCFQQVAFFIRTHFSLALHQLSEWEAKELQRGSKKEEIQKAKKISAHHAEHKQNVNLQ